jgi:hypothetical protein
MRPSTEATFATLLLQGDRAYYATPSRTTAGLVSARWRRPGGDALSLEIRVVRARPRDTDATLPMAPEGTRNMWNLAFRWVRAGG